MENRNALAFVAVTLGLLIGFFFGRSAAPTEAPPAGQAAEPLPIQTPGSAPDSQPSEAAASRPQRSPGPAGNATPAPRTESSSPQSDAEQILSLQGEVELLRGMLRGQELAATGEAIPWPEDRPERFRQAGYRAALEEAIDSCAPPVELVGLDCDEPPCVALLRTGQDWHDALVNRCPTWRDRYGTTVSQSVGEIDCEDGSTEQIAMLSPYDEEWEDGLGKEELGEVRQRLRHRWEQLRGDWTCGQKL